MGLSTRRVRRLRKIAERQKCSEGPKFYHVWEYFVGPDGTGGVREGYECTQCHTTTDW